MCQLLAMIPDLTQQHVKLDITVLYNIVSWDGAVSMGPFYLFRVRNSHAYTWTEGSHHQFLMRLSTGTRQASNGHSSAALEIPQFSRAFCYRLQDKRSPRVVWS